MLKGMGSEYWEGKDLRMMWSTLAVSWGTGHGSLFYHDGAKKT